MHSPRGFEMMYENGIVNIILVVRNRLIDSPMSAELCDKILVYGDKLTKSQWVIKNWCQFSYFMVIW